MRISGNPQAVIKLDRRSVTEDEVHLVALDRDAVFCEFQIALEHIPAIGERQPCCIAHQRIVC